MTASDHFTRVQFKNFKAFKSFTLDLRGFNVLVGPNNAGKSTILSSFRILSAAIRRAESRKAEFVHGPLGITKGHKIDLSTISVAEENLFYDYNFDEPASVVFSISSRNSLTLFFPEPQVCYLLPDAQGRAYDTPASFRRSFKCQIGFVPILGPVEHNETLYEKEAARRAVFNYRAARNFRNIWWHIPDRFEEFRDLIQSTWPGMDVKKPELSSVHGKNTLHMYCPENRKDRELFWSGSGFQVWCQMLTHVIQWKSASVFLIDEPDIYLHSDLQRQLVSVLRSLGPDIIIATHSPEIVTEVDIEELIVIDKTKQRGSRIKSPDQLEGIFKQLGSSINPVLTQLAKTRRALFVEGTDFKIIGRFARKMDFDRLSSHSEFAVVPVGGFNPARIKDLKLGMEQTLGLDIVSSTVFDRDYRSEREISLIADQCKGFCQSVILHDSKEIENLLLVPAAIDRAATARLFDRASRGGYKPEGKIVDFAAQQLSLFAEEKKSYILSQYIAFRRRHERAIQSSIHDDVIIEEEVTDFQKRWNDFTEILKIIPGKEALSYVNRALQNVYGINVTSNAIIDSMHSNEVSEETRKLIEYLEIFRKTKSMK